MYNLHQKQKPVGLMTTANRTQELCIRVRIPQIKKDKSEQSLA